MKKFVSQPTEPGHALPYCVAVYDPAQKNYVPLKGEEYSTKEESDRRAEELNEKYQQECDDTDTNTNPTPNRIPPETAHHISRLEDGWREIDSRDNA